MLTKEQMYSIVGELWFENSPKIFDFLANYMSIDGAVLKYSRLNTPRLRIIFLAGLPMLLHAVLKLTRERI